MRNSSLKAIAVAAVLLLVSSLMSSCGDEKKADTSTGAVRTQAGTTTAATSTKPAEPSGIQLDANLKSATGVPTDDEMPELIKLQQKVPYPVVVPTDLPSNHVLEKELIGFGAKNAKDPVGYYSFRYSDPSNANRSLTFNQSRSNSKPLSGYYLTEVELNGITYQVYWHKTLEYLPQGDPVRSDSVGEAETFVVVWKDVYNDPVTGPQELWYSVQSGTWTTSWGEIQSVLSSLKPLSGVAG
ncbi:MAG: hypothetical protein HZB44_06265 [Actinobacteria bacterium]|nr:hypothetical protein [Actinomycetota bacterium]